MYACGGRGGCILKYVQQSHSERRGCFSVSFEWKENAGFEIETYGKRSPSPTPLPNKKFGHVVCARLVGCVNSRFRRVVRERGFEIVTYGKEAQRPSQTTKHSAVCVRLVGCVNSTLLKGRVRTRRRMVTQSLPLCQNYR